MATSGKKVTYREPAGYFNADMRKAAQDWDKEHAGKKATKATIMAAAMRKAFVFGCAIKMIVTAIPRIIIAVLRFCVKKNTHSD